MHTGGEQTAIGVQTAVAALPEESPVEEAGLQVARDIFPESEGWTSHYANVVEITQGFPLDPYQLVWHLEKRG